MYIRFTLEHNTNGKAISWQQNTNKWRYSFYNRRKGEVEVLFLKELDAKTNGDTTPNILNNL